jgi:signal recognition particle subunit SRP68
MEITDYIFKEREEVLLVGDYNAYRAHATRRLHKLRKKLGQTTPKGRKYTAKAPVTSENVGTNASYVSPASLYHGRKLTLSLPDSSTYCFSQPNGRGRKPCT